MQRECSRQVTITAKASSLTHGEHHGCARATLPFVNSYAVDIRIIGAPPPPPMAAGTDARL